MNKTASTIPFPEGERHAQTASSLATASIRILVADDSPVTQDMLERELSALGHHVDLASDGEAALAALMAQPYDLAIIDFHMPKIDGLEVAARFKKQSDGVHTRFIAITSDIRGLLSHAADCENFDEVIPKPLDLDDVIKAVDQTNHAHITIGETRSSPPPKTTIMPELRASAAVATSRLEIEGRAYEFLRWPEDLSAQHQSARSLQANLDHTKFDAIVINTRATVRDLSVIWTTKSLHLLPVIDMTGALGAHADIDASKLSTLAGGAVETVIRDFGDKRMQLNADLIHSDDIGEKLLGRMFVSNGLLRAYHDPNAREYTSYNATIDFRSIEKEMRDLVAEGLVEQGLFDRFHVCDRCGSSHFNVREECPECHSPQLEEEAYLHHFRCAYQGPESDFRRGDDLICPKCRRELTHFSVDYDKPGSMLRCHSCQHATSEPVVGFLCMECGSHSNGDAVRTRDVYHYKLTNRGYDFAKAGRALLEGQQQITRFAQLPLELIVAINSEMKKYEAEKKPFVLLNISYRNARELEFREGLRNYIQARDLFVENLRATLPKGDIVVRGQTYDFALLKGASRADAQVSIKGLIKDAATPVRLDLGAEVDLFGPEDFR